MDDALKSLACFDQDTWLLFRTALVRQQFAQGEIILRPGQVCRHIFFLQTGLLRTFQIKDGDERTVAFALENSFVTDLKSLRTEQPTDVTIQALEPATLFSLAKADLIGLYGQSHQIEAFGRKVLEMLLEAQEEQASWFKLYSAKERYALLLQKQPALVQRVSLGHLASFIGIRRETLSRIRRLP